MNIIPATVLWFPIFTVIMRLQRHFIARLIVLFSKLLYWYEISCPIHTIEQERNIWMIKFILPIEQLVRGRRKEKTNSSNSWVLVLCLLDRQPSNSLQQLQGKVPYGKILKKTHRAMRQHKCKRAIVSNTNAISKQIILYNKNDIIKLP